MSRDRRFPEICGKSPESIQNTETAKSIIIVDMFMHHKAE